jgi:hypothetical protein
MPIALSRWDEVSLAEHEVREQECARGSHLARGSGDAWMVLRGVARQGLRAADPPCASGKGSASVALAYRRVFSRIGATGFAEVRQRPAAGSPAYARSSAARSGR